MWRWPDDLEGRIATVVAVVGVGGFLFQFMAGAIPNQILDRIELPNSLGAARVTAPDGRVFIVSEPFGRVQRYGPAGFERGFAVDSRGGAMQTGMSLAGHLLICSARAGHSLIAYDPDGREVGERQPCTSGAGGLLPDARNYPQNAKVPTIANSWLAALAVPLWHPFTGWAMAAAAALYLRFRGRTTDAGG